MPTWKSRFLSIAISGYPGIVGPIGLFDASVIRDVFALRVDAPDAKAAQRGAEQSAVDRDDGVQAGLGIVATNDALVAFRG